MRLKYLYLMLLILPAFQACKKEYPSFPYNNMLNFTIKDANGEELKGAIENDQIILYWPPEQAIPERITPLITIPERATIQPAIGTSVPFDETVTYTITAEDGSVATYHLKPVINTPIPAVTQLVGFMTYNNKEFINTTGTVSVMGDYFNPEEGKTQVFFIKASGEEVPVSIRIVTPVQVQVACNVPGVYKAIRIATNGKQVISSRNFDVALDTRPTFPPASVTAAQSVRVGEQLTISGGVNIDKVTSVSLRDKVTRLYVPVTLKTQTATGLSIEIPAGFPTGEYIGLRFEYPGSDYYAAGAGILSLSTFPITVTP